MQVTAANGKHVELDIPVEVACVPPTITRQIWPFARTFLIKAQLACGEDLDENFTLQELEAARMLLWVGYRGNTLVGALTTRLWPSRAGLACHLVAIAGEDMKSWLPLLDRIESYAKAEGCAKMVCVGRLGWERALPEYHRTGIILEKGL